MCFQTLRFKGHRQALESLYARLDSVAGDFGPSDIDPVEYGASMAEPSA